MRSPSFKYIICVLAVLCSLLNKLPAQPPNCNSVPSITGFTPAIGPSNTIITINGSNFDPVNTNNKVYLGATKATVMASTANSLTVNIPTGSTFFPISVSNACQLTAFSKDPFITSFSCGDTLFNNCFLHETDLATDQSPVDLGAADIDLNGKPDLVCINNGAASFSVFPNSSIIRSFAFLQRTNFPTLVNPVDLELKDFDGDGLIDVCVLSSTMSIVSFFRNLSTVNNFVFAPAIDIPVPVNTSQFSLNDIDNDGKLDLISCSGNIISVSLNASLNGALLFLPNVNYNAGSTIASFTTYDLDADQKVDLALSTGIGGSGAVEILKNNSNPGSVNFSAAGNYSNGAGPNHIIAGDLDNDGKGEIVTSNPQNPFVIIYKNSSTTGTIQLNAPVFVGTNSISHTVSMANVDGDTKPDLVISNVLFNTVSVLKNLSGLQFTPAYSFNTGSNPGRIAIVDLDGDHKPEINTANVTANSITILRNEITRPTRPRVTLTASPSPICQGDFVTFTASTIDGGPTPFYRWRINSTQYFNNLPVFTTGLLNNQDTVWVKMTSSLSCAVPNADSAYIVVTINPHLLSSVSLSASANNVCQGTPITFTATPVNGGNAVYTWRKNNQPLGNNSSTYSSSSLVNGDTIWVKTVSSLPCTYPGMDSAYIVVNVLPSFVPQVVLTASSTTVCAGTPVNFTATSTNGGPSPVYRWRRNGVTVGSNTATFSASNLNDQDSIWVIMTSSLSCATPATDSAFIIVTVNPVSTPTVSLTASATTICQGAAVSFTATPINGGNPTYIWRKNGNPVGTNSPTFTTNAIVDQDTIWVKMISSLTCTTRTADSAYVIITVSPTLVPSVTMTVNQNSVCQGAPVTFTATATNGGSPVYQWRKNNIPVGTNSPNFTTTAINNQDTIWVKMTSTLSCTSPNADSTYIIMTVNPLIPPSVSLTASATTVCAGSPVNFTATGNNGGTNPVYSWRRNGMPVGTNSTTFNAANLNDRDTIWVTMTSNHPCASPQSDSAYIIVTVTPVVTPSVGLTASATTICQGAAVSFTATPANGGSPIYVWRKNGNPVGTNSPTFTTNAIVDQDTIWVKMISSLGCTTRPADSAYVIITVSPTLVPAVTMTVNQNSICQGAPVTFTATATNGGSPVYQWRKNNTPVGTNSPTFTTTAINNQDTIWVKMISSISCASPNADSTYIIMNVNPLVPPSVSLTASATTVCAGSPVNFTATGNNGGANPVFKWRKNGIPVGTNSNSFTSSSISNLDTVWVTMISNHPCASPGADSAYIIINVTPVSTPAVNLVASATTVCQGSAVSFTANATNGGNNPVYSWRKNGIPVGTNSPTFTTTALSNQDTVWVKMISSLACTSRTADSAYIIITINPTLTATVGIAASATTVCQGEPVTFTASPVNGGTAVYSWRKNGIPVGTNSPTFTTSSLNNQDTIWVKMISSLTCASPNADSAYIIITVNPLIPPAVSLAASATTICAGSPVNFTATGTNAGTNPVYSWRRNAIPVGTNSATFNASNLNDRDTIWVTMTSNNPCASPRSDSAYTIINVTPLSTPSVSLAASTTTICQGATVSFTASSTNGGVNPVFSWRKNGVPVGTNSSTFTTSSINNQDTIWVRMVSSLSCISRNADSAYVIINVNPLIPPTVSLSASATTVCAGSPVNFTATATNAGTNPVYSWRRNGMPVGTNASTYTASNLINQDTVWVTMTSNHPCASPRSDSSYIIITVTPNAVPAVGLTSSATTICQGGSVSFTATPTNGGTNPIYSWRKNGMAVGTNSPTFTTNSINDQDTIWVTMRSNLPCVSPGADSAYIIIRVTPLITPSVALTASANSICPGTPVNFTAVPVNGGNTPSFSWSINSTPAGTNSPGFTSSTLANQDTVWVTMNSSLACANPVTTRDYVVMSVLSNLAPSVNISASTNSICQGSPVTFTATPTNGGTAPAYSWRVNGVPAVGSNFPVFTTSSLVQGDRVDVILTSNLTCASPLTAISNAVTMAVTPIISPSVSISANPNPICPSVATTFTASVINAGSSYKLQWFRNNSAVGGNSSSITLSDLKPNDTIYTRVTSNSPCVSPAWAISNKLSVVIDDVSCPKEIYVPTGFTPNNDRRNDLLKPIIRGHAVSYSFTVYNRWGEKVFESFDPAKGWDGKFNGLGLDTQVFVWYCTYQFVGRPKQMVKGTVSLIR